MGTTNYKVYHSIISPQQAFKELYVEQDLIVPSGDSKISKSKRKRGIDTLSSVKVRPDINLKDQSDENVVRKKLTEHFLLLHDITENQRLKGELDRTTLSLNLYKQYKKKKRQTRKTR
ncbi:unnamed protein product [Fraxinus pennsylvanica]|uniref:Uncharacterized protein n=1 Tax=Fraxinus pennsylvanica TaxID=56036 RepID=A0AAD1ZT37_9LAMI|nr:unnamed protein product [Fraxinus pennsylvanica]